MLRPLHLCAIRLSKLHILSLVRTEDTTDFPPPFNRFSPLLFDNYLLLFMNIQYPLHVHKVTHTCTYKKRIYQLSRWSPNCTLSSPYMFVQARDYQLSRWSTLLSYILEKSFPVQSAGLPLPFLWAIPITGCYEKTRLPPPSDLRNRTLFFLPLTLQ